MMRFQLDVERYYSFEKIDRTSDLWGIFEARNYTCDGLVSRTAFFFEKGAIYAHRTHHVAETRIRNMVVEADTGCRQNLGFLAPHIIPLPEPSLARRSRVTGSKEGDFEAEWGPSDNGNDKLGIWLREISLLVREMQSPFFCRLAELFTGVLCPTIRPGYQMVFDPYTDRITAAG